jgi:regulator of replication initiation timing
MGISPEGKIWNLFKRLEEMERELTAARAEIGRLKSQLTKDQGCVTISRNGYVQELEQQRDRLAVALQECREDSVELLGERDWWQNEPRLGYQKRYQDTRDNVTRADEALAAVKGGEQ